VAEGPVIVGDLGPPGEGPFAVGDLGFAVPEPEAPPYNLAPRDRVYARLMPRWD
jgi:hypothetical protein